MKRINFITILFLVLAGLTQAVASTPDWIHLTNGKHVTDIKADGDILWVGTKGGLVKWDRVSNEKTFYNVANSGLPSDKVEAIAVNADGSIWIGTYDQGIVLFDGTDWTVYNSDNSDMSVGSIYDLDLDENGDLWVAASFHLVHFDGQNFESFTPPTYAQFTTLLVRSSTDIELAWDVDQAHGDQLFRFDGYNVTIDSSLQRTGIYRLYNDSQQRTWACYTGGIARRSGNSWVRYDSTNIAHLKGQVLSMAEFDNEIYVGTEKGLYTFDGYYWGVAAAGLRNANYMTVDGGKLYIGTLEDGLIERSGNYNNAIDVSFSRTPANVFQSMTRDQNGELMLTSMEFDGVTRFANNVWSELPNIDEIAGTAYMQVTSDGTFWGYDITTRKLYRYMNGQLDSWDPADYNMPSSAVNCMNVADDGTVYYGTYSNGFVKFDGTNWTHYTRTSSDLTANTVRGIEVIDDKVYIALEKESTSGVYYPGGLDVLYQNQFTHYDTSNSGLETYYIEDIIAVGDSIWIGGNKGITLFYNGVMTHYNIGKTAKLLVADPNGGLWFSGYDQVGTYTLDKWYNGQIEASFDETTNLFGADAPYPYVRDMEFDNFGNLWVINSRGTFLYKDGGVSFFEEPDTTVGINDDLTASSFKVYPNPVTDVLTVTTTEQGTLELFNLSGAEVMRKELSSEKETLDISALTPGLYIYQITNGTKTEQGKLLVR